MDLQALQSQLKAVIQNHQIIVSKMRNDPQNPSLQKQLHDLQAEIMALSEKQKQVVQQLRKELEKKKQNAVLASTVGLPSSTAHPLLPSAHSHSPHLQSHEVRFAYSPQRLPAANHRLNAPVQALALSAKQFPLLNSLRHPVPSTINNLVSSGTTLTFKAPVATAVVLSNNSSTTNALLTSKPLDHQKLQPVLVVPSPGRGTVDGPHAGVVLNLVPPIRVPQYPPPPNRLPSHVSPQKHHTSSPHHITISASTTTAITTITSVVRPPVSSEKNSVPTPTIQQAVSSPPPSPVPKAQVQSGHSVHEKAVNRIDPKKKEFMSSLGLVTKDSLNEICNRKTERKRRTTANPQFSNAALEEKSRNAAAAAAAASSGNHNPVPTKRPRGRPRLDSKPVITVAPNIFNSTTSSNVVTVTSTASITITSTPTLTTVTSSTTTCSTSNSSEIANTEVISPVTTTSPVPVAIVNGVHKQHIPVKEEQKEISQALCANCAKPGELLRCALCSKSYHHACIHPPAMSYTDGPWQCPECQVVTSASNQWTVAAVHSYVALKSAKEEEKKKLLKRSLELGQEKSQLETRLHYLRGIVAEQENRHGDLDSSYQKVQECIKRLYIFVNKLQQFS